MDKTDYGFTSEGLKDFDYEKTKQLEGFSETIEYMITLQLDRMMSMYSDIFEVDNKFFKKVLSAYANDRKVVGGS